MFKNRKITVTVDKKNEGPDFEALDHHLSCEEKAELFLRTFEKVGKKVFIGICIYVILDTHRKVSVARASQPENTTFQIKAP